MVYCVCCKCVFEGLIAIKADSKFHAAGVFRMVEEKSESSMSQKMRKLVGLISKQTTFVTTLSVFVAAIVHIVNVIPEAKKNLFPVHGIVLLDLYNRQRVVLGNTGDYDYHLSHLSYSHNAYSADTIEVMKEMLSDVSSLHKHGRQLYSEVSKRERGRVRRRY